MLQDREIESNLGSSKYVFKATKGCPQGGVLSPLLWTIVADSLIKRLTLFGFHVEAFADDMVISIGGKFGCTVSERMQDALKVIEIWCQNTELRVNPQKTTVIPFYRIKNEYKKLRPLQLFGETLEYSKEVKYLGIILDTNLNWNAHLSYVMNKASIILWTSRSMVSQTWGLQPKMVMWLYKMIVVPVISYASVVWWTKTNQITTQNRLSKIQRTACLLITGAMHSTPTAAMEVLLNLPPLHLIIQKEARITNYYMYISDKKEINKLYDENLYRSMVRENDIFKHEKIDKISAKYEFGKQFNIEIPTREDWELGRVSINEGAAKWYTDGSRMNDSTGTGVYEENGETKISLNLGKYTTVFMAEVYGIHVATQECLKKNYNDKEICILTDSRAAILATASNKFTSNMVWECRKSIDQLIIS